MRSKNVLLSKKDFLKLLLMGGILGWGLILLDQVLEGQKPPQMQATEAVAEEERGITYSKNIFYCTSLCYTPPEKTVEPQRVVRRPAGPRTIPVASIPKDAKNPNAIRISLREAPPILAEVKMVNGRPTCSKKNDKPRKSKKTDSVHIDQECCLDPDEIPNPRCVYL